MTLATGALAAPAQSVPGVLNPDLLSRALRALDQHRSRIAIFDRIGVVDFTVASHNPRFHVVDLISGKSHALLVAHGRGSDPGHLGFVQRFSNTPGSAASSNGAYLTGERYIGRHGASARLIGLDPANSNAERRAIVLHAANYVGVDHARRHGKLGRSQGCFAVAPAEIAALLHHFGIGRMIYADRLS